MLRGKKRERQRPCFQREAAVAANAANAVAANAANAVAVAAVKTVFSVESIKRRNAYIKKPIVETPFIIIN